MLRFLLTTFAMAFLPMIARAACYPATPPTQMSGYIPFTFMNNYSNITASQVFVTMTAQTANGEYVFLTVGSNGIAATVPASAVVPSPYSYSLEDLPNNAGYVYLPEGLSNGEIYIGIDYPVTLTTLYTATTGAFPWSITPATAGNDKTNANYYHLYDSVMFTTNNSKLALFLNLNNEYGLSLSAAVGSNTSGGIPLNTSFLGLPPTVPRDVSTSGSVLGSYSYNVSQITNTASQAQWAGLTATVHPAGSASVILRLFSPAFGMTLTPTPLFDPSYLFNDVYGTGMSDSNWFYSVWANFYGGGYPSPNTLYLSLSAINTPAQNYTTYYLNSVTMSSNILQFMPTDYGAIVSLSPAPTATSSQNFFTGGFVPSGDTLAGGLIANYVTEGFCTGVFPQYFTASSPLTQDDFIYAYTATSSIFWGGNPSPSGGPWYDLYSATLHRLGPFTAVNNYSNYQVDGADGPLGFYMPVQASLGTMPYVAIIIGDLTGTTFPDYSDSTTYTINIAAAPAAECTYNGMTFTTGQMFSSVTLPIDLTVRYPTSTIYTGVYSSQIWFNGTIGSLNYSIVYPQTPYTTTVQPPPTMIDNYWNIAPGQP